MSIIVKNTSAPSHTKPSKWAQKGYVPDLSAFMSLCDANYVKFMKLLPNFYSDDENGGQECNHVRSFGLSRNQHELGLISIEIIESAKYTTTLNVKQLAEAGFIPATRMQVRLYHDASMAEVLSYQGIDKLKANYAYPNKRMLQKDEKALCNEFLADWLSYCLKFGYSISDPMSKNFSGEKVERLSVIKEDDHK